MKYNNFNKKIELDKNNSQSQLIDLMLFMQYAEREIRLKINNEIKNSAKKYKGKEEEIMEYMISTLKIKAEIKINIKYYEP